MEKSEYRIGKITYYQTELTWGQDKRIMELLNRASGKFNGSDQLKVSAKTAFELLSKYDLLGEFWGIVLIPDKPLPYYFHRCKFLLGRLLKNKRGSLREIDLSDAPNSLIKEMFDDFFLLNKLLMKKLSGLNSVLDLIAKTMETKENSKSPSTSGKPKPKEKSMEKS
jgi:hypothetical protein